MAMDFWQKQAEAKRNTGWLVTMFFVMVIAVAAIAELTLRAFVPEMWREPPYFGIFFIVLICGVAAYNMLMVSGMGGSYVAKAVGGRLVTRDTPDPQERMLLNIVDEMAIASSVPTPPVFILPATAINAFAAGNTPQKAAIAVTQGALDKLNRDEIQGVVAHEFGHIHNGDMRMSMRLSAMLMGFFGVMYVGYLLLRVMSFSGSSRSSSSGKKGDAKGAIMLVALGMIVAGFITWMGGLVLRACVSRQREYLADACSVQFTRNPDGLASALRKIGADSDHAMPKEGSPYAHLYLHFGSGQDSIFATHPPLTKRISAILGHTNMPPEEGQPGVDRFI